MLGWWRDWAGRVFVQQQASQTGQARDSRRQELEAKLRPAVVPDDHPSQLGGGEIEIKLLLVHALYNSALHHSRQSEIAHRGPSVPRRGAAV